MISSFPSCIVLGAGGFLGTNLCKRLLAEGVRVRAFGRRRTFPDALAGIDWQQGDFNDPAALAAAMEDYEIVFHLVHAATPDSANHDVVGDLQRTVMPSVAMLEICPRVAVRRVVFVSSGGTVYGPSRQIPTPETAATDPITAYGINKLTVEKYLALYERLRGVEFRVLRVANPFGPFQLAEESQGIVAALISRTFRDEPIEIWGDGSIVRDYVFVDDVSDALVAAALDRSDARIFNIGSGIGRSLREVIAAIEAQFGGRLNIEWKPGRQVDVPVSTLAITRARDVLGWTPKTSFERGLEETIGWWKARLGGRLPAGPGPIA